MRHAREQRGISQDDLAVRIGRDQRAISEYELGKRKVAAIDLPTLARELGVTVGYFFEESSESELDSSVLREFHRLPNEVSKHAVIAIVRAFAESLFDQLNTK